MKRILWILLVSLISLSLQIYAAETPQPFFTVNPNNANENLAWYINAQFHPFGQSIRNIPIKKIDDNWCAATEFTKDIFPHEFYEGDIGLDAIFHYGGAFSLTDKFDGVHQVTVLVGIYQACDEKTGTFILVINKKKSDKPVIFLAQDEKQYFVYITRYQKNGFQIWDCYACDSSTIYEWDKSSKEFIVKHLEEEANEEVNIDTNSEMQPLSVVFKEPEMVKIPTGNYEMDVESDNKEMVHVVNVIPSFEIGKYEVTQGLWMSVMGVYENPSAFSNCGESRPVENVNWTEVQEFIRRLNIRTGKRYRLPTELEWEYACRGGAQNRYCGSDNADLVAWYSGNSGNQTHPVGQKQKNGFGLYDMSGNVWEWVDGKDVVDNNLHMLRGGSFLFKPLRVHVADRNVNDPSKPGIDFGFRLAISQ